MALDARKLQKKKEKRNAKRRSLEAARKASVQPSLKGVQARPENFPILDCCRTTDLFEKGIGYVLISRSLPGRHVAGSLFLVDTYCLGVKNTMTFMLTHGSYTRDMLRGPIFGSNVRQTLEPAAARKLVEGAVAYAHGLGIAPHADYSIAKEMFGAIDSADCREEFVYGTDGKPFYVAGPDESIADARAIISKLRQSCGDGGFDYLVPMFFDD